MKAGWYALVAFGLVLAGPVAARADDAADARAIVDKAIKAHGGDALTKYKAVTVQMKGTVQAMGQGIEFSGEVATHGPERQKLDIEASVAGQKFRVVNVLNGDKGWTRFGDETMELDKDKIAEAKEQAHAGWVASLVPLKEKGYTLTTVGEAKVNDKPAVGVKVSYKGRRDVDLYFDKASGLLVKSEARVRDEESGQEVNEETFYSDYKEVQGTQQAMKFLVKRDGKVFMEGEATSYELTEKLPDSVFDKP
jgi:hypothetical protein